MLTGIATQGDMNKFIDAGSAQRDLVMSRFLDLLIFEKMSQFAKDDSSMIKAEVKSSPDKGWDTIITTRNDELQRQISEITRLEKVLKDKRANLDTLRIQLATEFSEDAITHVDVKRLQLQTDELRVRLEAARPLYYKAIEISQNLAADLVAIQSALTVVPVKELQEKLKSISVLKDTLAILRQSYEKERQILVGQEKSVKRLLEVPCGDQFPNCKYIKDSHADKLKLVTQKQSVDDLLTKITEAEIALRNLQADQIEVKLMEHSALLRKESNTNLKLIQSKQAIADRERELIELEKKVTKSEMELTDHLSRVVEDNGSENIKRSIRELENQIDDLDSKRVKAASTKGSLITEIARLQAEKERYEMLKSQWYMYEMFIQATSKKGIPTQIIQLQLPVINAEISRILHGVVDYTLKFEKDDDSNTEIYIDYGDSKRLIELGSGMEKMISSLAIRVALQNASSLPRPDFLIIDEGFGTLDEMNIEACNRLLVSLKRWYKNIIVISHIDGVKDVTDNVIDISRVGKDSYVRFD
jgi:DNA repair exonuclease SbcCD ATPase subunit